MTPFSALRGKRGEYLVAVQFVLFFAFIFAPHWNPYVDSRLLEMLSPLRWTLLTVFFGVALVLGAFGVAHIREYLTPLPYPVDHSEVVQHGVYAWVRHPLYSSQLFAAFGWTLFSFSLSHLLILILGFAFFDYKANKEERWLTERHPHYADYVTRVRKFLPGVY